MKNVLLLFALSLTFISLNAQTDSKTPSVDEILSTYFENTGGIDNWKKLNSMRSEGNMSQGGMEFPGIIYQKRPNLQRLEINIQGQEMIQAYDGTTAWWINPFMGSTDAQPMPPEMAEEFTSDLFEDEFIDYAKKGHSVELLGEAEIDGTACYELKLTKKTGEEEFYYFETENLVPIMQKTIAKSGPMKGQAVETYLSDYLEYGDFIVPTFMETRIGGAAQFSITVTKIEFNVELDDKMFAYPKAAVVEEVKD